MSEARPADAAEATAWDVINQKALTFIQLSVDDGQIKHIRNAITAADAWTALKEAHKRDTPGKFACCVKLSGKRHLKAMIYRSM